MSSIVYFSYLWLVSAYPLKPLVSWGHTRPAASHHSLSPCSWPSYFRSNPFPFHSGMLRSSGSLLKLYSEWMLCNCLAQQSCLPLAPPWGYLKPNLVTKCSVSLVRQWYVLRRCLTCVFLPDLTGDHTCCRWNLGLLAQEAGPGSQNSLGGPEPSQGEGKRLETELHLEQAELPCRWGHVAAPRSPNL